MVSLIANKLAVLTWIRNTRHPRGTQERQLRFSGIYD